MTMYVVKVGTNVKTANQNYADSAAFDFYGPFTRPVADELADEVRAAFAKHGPRNSSTVRPWSRSLASPPTPPRGTT